MPNYNTVALHESIMGKFESEFTFSGQDFELWQSGLRAGLRQLLGLNRMPGKCELAPQTLWTRKHEYGSIEKFFFTSEPGYQVPAYLCLPDHAESPYTTFICLQGHSSGMHNSVGLDFHDETKVIDASGDMDFAIGCMKRGIAALCIEQRGFGECEDERLADWIGRCHNPAAQAMMLGRTLIGERVYDVDRALDYLLSRQDIAAGRIGVMGNSGGGTVSMFAGALLDRLAYVMPSCCVASFRDSIMSINHCICNYVPGLLALADCAEICALACPKPLVVVSGRGDDIFPWDSAHSSFRTILEVYRAAGAEDLCRHVTGPEGHRFYADLAWKEMFALI